EQNSTVIEGDNTIDELRNWSTAEGLTENYYIVVDSDYQYIGIVSSSSIFSHHQDKGQPIKSLIKRQPAYLRATNSLKEAIHKITQENVDVLPVLAARGSTVIRSEEHTSELQSRENLVCRLLLEKKNNRT